MPKAGKKVAILSIEGTNCDAELNSCFQQLGADPEVVDLKQLTGEVDDPSLRRRLADYDVLMFPGGFSAGDYVRAGAIMAARIRSALGKELFEFVEDPAHLVGGICNGFQVLVELGLLPGRPGNRLSAPQACLTTNDSARFECRPTFVSWEGGNFRPFSATPKGSVYFFPSAHGEGKLVLSGTEGTSLKDLEAAGQILFRWVDPDGEPAGYPWNPNGSEGNVAGITNPEGNVFGLMPHPERSISLLQYPDYTRRGVPDGPGDGWKFLEAVVRYARRSGY